MAQVVSRWSIRCSWGICGSLLASMSRSLQHLGSAHWKLGETDSVRLKELEAVQAIGEHRRKDTREFALKDGKTQQTGDVSKRVTLTHPR